MSAGETAAAATGPRTQPQIQPRRSGNIAADARRGLLADFFRLRPGDLDSLEGPQDGGPDRAALADALRAYHQDLGTLDGGVEAQLQRLAHPRSRVVVTGQQAGLLGGPAYSVHKGASAALLARELDREEAPVLPVYWVASQDHDAAEVASTTLLDFSETLHRLTLDLPEGRMIGRVPWTPEWTAEVRALIERFGAPAELKARLTPTLDFALAGRSYADVFARLMQRLLGPQGLVVLDPLHPALARLAVPAMKKELERPLESSAAIERAAAGLTALGYTPQLRRPAGASNLFLEGDDGQRRLLRVSGTGEGTVFDDGQQRLSRSELEALLEADPGRLTPAAGLRPIIQDSVLPTAAFVVGPGEIAYGAQLREVYPLHGLQQPLLWPRLSVTWLESNVARLLARLGVSAAQLQADPEGVLGAALARERGAGAAAAGTLEALQRQFAELSAQLASLDPTLEGAGQRAGAKALAQLERLQGLSRRALARAEDERGGQLTRLRLHLLPNGVPQEREMNFLTYLLKHGEEPLRLLMTQAPGGATPGGATPGGTVEIELQ